MGKHYLEKRLTFKYVGEYSHLDAWESVGVFDRLTTRRVKLKARDEEDMCEPRLVKHYGIVKADEGATEDDVKQALRDTFTKAGCAHEWDCCGCRSYYAREPKRVTGDLWCVPVYSSRNY